MNRGNPHSLSPCLSTRVEKLFRITCSRPPEMVYRARIVRPKTLKPSAELPRASLHHLSFLAEKYAYCQW